MKRSLGVAARIVGWAAQILRDARLVRVDRLIVCVQSSPVRRGAGPYRGCDRRPASQLDTSRASSCRRRRRLVSLKPLALMTILRGSPGMIAGPRCRRAPSCRPPRSRTRRRTGAVIRPRQSTVRCLASAAVGGSPFEPLPSLRIAASVSRRRRCRRPHPAAATARRRSRCCEPSRPSRRRCAADRVEPDVARDLRARTRAGRRPPCRRAGRPPRCRRRPREHARSR